MLFLQDNCQINVDCRANCIITKLLLAYSMLMVCSLISFEGEQTREPNRGPHRPEVSHPRMSREVMPGVFSTVPRGRASIILKKKQKQVVSFLS